MSARDVAKLNEDALELESRLLGWEMDAEEDDRAALRGKVAEILKAPNTRQGAEDAIMAAVNAVDARAFRRTARLATLVMLHIMETGRDAGALFDTLDKMDDALDEAAPEA